MQESESEVCCQAHHIEALLSWSYDCCLQFVHDFGQGGGKDTVRKCADHEHNVYDPIACSPCPICGNYDDGAEHQGEAVWAIVSF